MEKSNAVSFTSSYFRIEANEDEHTNPGVYGHALAQWMAEELRGRGLGTPEVIAEDWGWCLIVRTDPVRVNLAIANVDGSKTRWRVFVFAERGPFQWLKNSGDLKQEVAELSEHLAAIVAGVPEVRDIAWEAMT